MARQIVVDIIGDPSGLNSAMDSAGRKAGGFRNVLQGVGQGIGQMGFGLVTGAIDSMVGALGEADAAYQEDMRSQAALRASLEANIPGFDGNTDAIEERIAAGMRLAFGDEEQRDSLARLIATTGDAEKSQELLAQAMDLARLRGIDLATASDIVGKVAGGNLGILSRYGIQLDANATSEEALATIQQMAAGQAQAYADGPLGEQEAAQLRVGESMEKIGAVINQVSSVVLPLAADAFANVVDWLSQTWTSIEPVVSALVKDLTPAFNAVVSILQTVAGVIGRVVGAVLPPLVSYIRFVASVWGNVFGTISRIINAWSGVVSGVIDRVTGIFRSVVNFITRLPGRIGRAASGMWDGIWDAFKEMLNSVIRAWNSIQFEVPRIEVGPVSFGGFIVGLPDIPTFHAGGVVPGIPGSDVPAILQAGERVIPRSQVGGGGDVYIQFLGPVVSSGSDIERLADMIAQRMRLSGATGPGN